MGGPSRCVARWPRNGRRTTLRMNESQNFIRIVIIMVMIVLGPSWCSSLSLLLKWMFFSFMFDCLWRMFCPSSSVRPSPSVSHVTAGPSLGWFEGKQWPMMSTPLKTNMEPKHGGVLQMILLLKGVIFRWTSRQFSGGIKQEVRKPMLCKIERHLQQDLLNGPRKNLSI